MYGLLLVIVGSLFNVACLFLVVWLILSSFVNVSCVLFVVCCVLIVVCGLSSFVVCCVLCAVCCKLFVVRCALRVYCWRLVGMLFFGMCSLLVASWLFVVVVSSLFVAFFCWGAALLFVVCCLLFVVCGLMFAVSCLCDCLPRCRLLFVICCLPIRAY